MISDTLSDAVAEIDRYLRDFPQCYRGAIRSEIIAVREAMDALRCELDRPPTDEEIEQSLEDTV
jgi:DNA-directed RNA polymerase specialized sigma subunit